MEKDKILISLVVIVLLVLVGFNLDKITGQATKNLIPSVSAYPTELKAGEKINIKVKPRDACVDPEVGFYFSGKASDGTMGSSGGRKAVVTQKGGFKICKGNNLILDPDGSFTISYQTRPDWDGDHYAKIYYWKDRNTKDSINVYFSVKP